MNELGHSPDVHHRSTLSLEHPGMMRDEIMDGEPIYDWNPMVNLSENHLI